MEKDPSSTVLKMKNLKQKLGLAINEYETKYKNLQDSLKYAAEHPDPQYVKLNNRIFVGDQLREIKKVGGAEQCEALCKSIKECSGATFFPKTSNCSTYSGNGIITPSLAENIAYVSDISQKTDMLAGIQNKITELSSELSSYDLTNETDAVYDEIESNQEVLMQGVQTLNSPPSNEILTAEYIDSIKMLKKNSISYTFWGFLFIVALIIGLLSLR